MRKLFIVLNSEKFLISHRLEIAHEAQRQGFDVYVLAPDTGYVNEVISEGLKFIKVDFNRSGVNPIKEIHTIITLCKLYKRESPDIIHHVTIKVCLLGCLAAKLAGKTSVVNAISGFGYAFSERASKMLRCFVQLLIRICLKNKNFRFIVQNPDDKEQLLSFGITEEARVTLIKGSGVDMNKFPMTPIPQNNFIYLFPSRMLYEKGVLEFIEAAKILKPQLNGKAQFILVGNCEDENKSVISKSEIESLTEPPYIEYLGFRTDMDALLRKSSVVVLPSYYREGLPKALIEGCATGRPIITTNLPGCKECVKNENGFYVKPKDAKDLAEKELILFNDRELCINMGQKSRELALRDFDVKNVVKSHLSIYKSFNV